MRWFVLFALFVSPFAHADKIQLLDRGDQSLAAFYSSIQGAKKSIDMATFVFEACDSVPKLLLDAMVQKAKKGVHVRLLIDAFSLKPDTKAALPAYLASVPNFELRYYNDAPDFLGNNMRSHIKAFVADGTTYIVGGRNMQDDYFGLGAKLNYVDNDLLVTGASAADAKSRFDELWAAGSSPGGIFGGLGGLFGHSRGNPDPRAFASSCLKISERDRAVADFAVKQGAAALAARPVRSCGVEYTLDRPGFESCDGNCVEDPNNDPQGDYLNTGRLRGKRMTAMWLDFVSHSTTSLEILNQYYMPVYRMDQALARLRAKNVPVEVISNATGDIEDPMQNTDFTCWIQSKAAGTSVGSQKVSLMTSKGSLGTPWDLSVAGAPWRIHAKSAIRNGSDVLVSSFNIDPRSYHTNLESGAVVSNCPDLAKDLEATYATLRSELESDKTCAACAAEILPENSANAFCAGATELF
jgi:putative cardiolipin synthase